MSARTPLVVSSGQLMQAAVGDSLENTYPTTAHVVSADLTIPAGASLTVTRYVEVAAGVTLEIGAGGDLEIS